MAMAAAVVVVAVVATSAAGAVAMSVRRRRHVPGSMRQEAAMEGPHQAASAAPIAGAMQHEEAVAISVLRRTKPTVLLDGCSFWLCEECSGQVCPSTMLSVALLVR